MQLNRSDRDAFVTAVMDDVPYLDYPEMCRNLVLARAATLLPPKVKAVWDDPKLRQFIACNVWQLIEGGLPNVYVPNVEGMVMDDETKGKVAELDMAYQKQMETRSKLQAKLYATINGCRTLKQAKAALPEFEKYLPADRDGAIDRSMPAVANLVADLNAAGWPKDKPAPKKGGKK